MFFAYYERACIAQLFMRVSIGNRCINREEDIEDAVSRKRKMLELNVGSVVHPIYPDWVPPLGQHGRDGLNPFFDMVGKLLDTATERGIQCYYVNGRVARFTNFVTNADVVLPK